MKQTIQEKEIRQKYAGLTYEELMKAAQKDNLTDLAFVMAQQELYDEFWEFISDRDGLVHDEEAASLFLELKDIRKSNNLQEPVGKKSGEDKLSLPTIRNETIEVLKQKIRQKGGVTIYATEYFPEILD